MNLEKLKESVVDALEDEDVTLSIQEEIKNASEEKAKLLFDEEKAKLEEECRKYKKELDTRSQKRINEVEQKAKEHEEELEEECQKFKRELTKRTQKRINEEVSKMRNILEQYTEQVTKDFLREHEEDFRMFENVTKVETILEGLKTVMAVAGIHTQEIIEGVEIRNNKRDNVLESRVKGLQDQLNQLHEENRSLKDTIEEEKQKHADLLKENELLNRENQDVVKMGVISELKNGLTLTESKKFEKMAKNIPFSADKDFIRKLKDLKESIQDLPVLNEVSTKPVEKQEENYRKFL
jgi:hypothetical protein